MKVIEQKRTMHWFGGSVVYCGKVQDACQSPKDVFCCTDFFSLDSCFIGLNVL